MSQPDSQVYQVYQDYQVYQVYQNKKKLHLAPQRAISTVLNAQSYSDFPHFKTQQMHQLDWVQSQSLLCWKSAWSQCSMLIHIRRRDPRGRQIIRLRACVHQQQKQIYLNIFEIYPTFNKSNLLMRYMNRNKSTCLCTYLCS